MPLASSSANTGVLGTLGPKLAASTTTATLYTPRRCRSRSAATQVASGDGEITINVVCRDNDCPSPVST